MPVPDVVAPIMVYDLAPPTPAANVLPHPRRAAADIKVVSRARPLRRVTHNKSMLSRTARSQMALLAAKPHTQAALSLDFFDDQDNDVGADDPDLHRFFNRPKVVHSDDQDDADETELSAHAQLRLFVARTRAVEAHRMLTREADQSSENDEAITDRVKSRLSQARLKAVQAHEKLFS